MKKINYSSFLFGILFSVAAFGIYSFTHIETLTVENNNIIEADVVEGISPELAMTYRNNYKTMNPEAIQAINVSVQQWQAINQELSYRNNDLSNVSGFRLYFGLKGLNRDSEMVALNYVINSNLQEDPPGSNVMMAEGFNRSFAQQCPPFCD